MMYGPDCCVSSSPRRQIPSRMLAHAITEGCKVDRTKHPNSKPAVLLPRLMGDVPDIVGGKAAIAQLHWAGDLFDMDSFAAVMMADLGCLVTDGPSWDQLVDRGSVQFVEGFLKLDIASKGVRDQGRELDLMYKGMVPANRIKEMALDKCRELVKEKLGPGPQMTIHMRVEDDWLSQCKPKKVKKKKKGPLDPTVECTNKQAVAGNTVFNALNMASVVQNTAELDAYRQRVFMLYAADRTNQGRMVKMVGRQPDPMNVWPKGTALTHPMQLGCFTGTGATYTERSVITFFLAAMSEGPFVGSPKSTFSNGVFLYRHWRSQPSYAYDCKKQKRVIAFNETKALRNPHWNPTTRQIQC